MLNSLLVVLGAAALSPILAQTVRKIAVPVAVIEVVLGIVLGPQVLGLIRIDPTVTTLSQLGVVFLFFLAGQAVDVERLKGAPLRVAALGWLATFGLALVFGLLGYRLGLWAQPHYAALAMSTTALSTLLPVLADAGHAGTTVGRYVLAAGVIGSFVPIVIIELLINPRHGRFQAALIFNAFFLLVCVALLTARRWRPRWLVRPVKATMHSSGQLAVRLSVVLLLALVALAVAVKLDVILAAFAAGLVVRQAMRDADVRAFVAKHEGIGYGVLIPVFFIATGARFDLRGLLANPLSLLLMVGVLGAFLLARGLPTALLARFVDRGLPGAALATLTATQLPLVVAVTDTAVSHRAMSSGVAAAFVGAGLLSVLVYPVIALATLSRRQAGTGQPETVA